VQKNTYRLSQRLVYQLNHRQASRGIKLTPASDIAALKVTFAYNSAELTSEASQTLDTLGEALRSSQLEQCCFQIEGDTDSKGSDGYNSRLSERRAQSVVRHLRQHFNIEAERMLTRGYGEKQPVADQGEFGSICYP
jgi:outer membrane protein OmpA-like peptidoglycan-associated protein